MRRVAVITALFALGCLLAGPVHAAQPVGGPASAAPPAAVAAAPAPAPSWAAAQIEAVVSAGVLGTDVDSFRPDDPLTRGELVEVLTALGKTVQEPADPERTVTMRELDAQIVGALGLLPSARRFRLAARDAGLQPSGMLGTETVARLLGLRLNHPQGQDELELSPNQPATRAEAAYSFARVLQLGPDTLAYVDQLSQGFALPQLTDWQRTVLTRALRFVGYPYVWTGVSEKRQKLWSSTAPGGLVSAPGGFDCSGFVWRVYKLQPFAGAPLLTEILKGRTTYAMSGEVQKTTASRSTTFSRVTSSSSAVAASGRNRPRSGTWVSTSAAAGWCTRRTTARRWCRCRAGTRRPSRGGGDRSQRQASPRSGIMSV